MIHDHNITIEFCEHLLEEKAKVNAVPIDQVKWFYKGKRVHFSEKLIRDFQMTGLSTLDFIRSGMYKMELPKD